MLQSKEKTSWIIFFLLSNSYGNIGQSVTEQDSNLGFRTFCDRCRTSRAAALRPFRSLRLSKSQAHFFLSSIQENSKCIGRPLFHKKLPKGFFGTSSGSFTYSQKCVLFTQANTDAQVCNTKNF